MIRINNRIIAKSYDKAATVLQQAIGLMFQSEVKKPLLFTFSKEKKTSLHMFFVFMPIDLIFISKGKKVVETKQNFGPFTLYFPKKAAKYLIECRAGTIEDYGIKLGQIVSF